jgi:hypothetical protein
MFKFVSNRGSRGNTLGGPPGQCSDFQVAHKGSTLCWPHFLVFEKNNTPNRQRFLRKTLQMVNSYSSFKFLKWHETKGRLKRSFVILVKILNLIKIEIGLGSFVLNLWLQNKAWDLSCKGKWALIYFLDFYKIKFGF